MKIAFRKTNASGFFPGLFNRYTRWSLKTDYAHGGVVIGSSYEIQNAAGVNSVTLVVQTGDTIEWPVGVASTNMVIDNGALIRLRSMGGNRWRVEALQGQYRIPGMTFPRQIQFSAAVPAAGTWSRGDRVFNVNATVGQPKSWVCTVAGTPGTWVSEGNL